MQAEKEKTERVTGLDRRTREEIAKWNQMTALRFQTGGRHQTFPASLRGILGTSDLTIVRSSDGSLSQSQLFKTPPSTTRMNLGNVSTHAEWSVARWSERVLLGDCMSKRDGHVCILRSMLHFGEV